MGKLLISAWDGMQGLADSKTEPHYSASSVINQESFTYDANNRCLTDVSPTKSMSYSYNGNSITSTNELTGQSTVKDYNSFGEMKQNTESGGNTINYTYNSDGQVRQIDVGSNSTLIGYDAYGNQNSLTDPDAGVTSYNYNSLGELTDQTDAKSNHYHMTYDLLSRIWTSVGSDGTTIYTYDTENHGVGKLAQVTGPSSTGIVYSYNYNNFGWLSRESEVISGHTFNTDYGYDSYGNINAITYPSGLIINKYYGNYGYLDYIEPSNLPINNIIYSNNNFNALGQVTNYTYGNGLTTQNTFDDHHHLLTSREVTTGSSALFHYTYGYDPSTFLMSSRTDNIHNKSESFIYDTYNRLMNITGANGVPSSTMSYDPNGNILSNTTEGNYLYASNAGVHAVTSIAINSNSSISQNPQDITYTPFNKVATIDENNYNMTFTYGPDHERKMVVSIDPDGDKTTKYYLSNYEKERD